MSAIYVVQVETRWGDREYVFHSGNLKSAVEAFDGQHLGMGGTVRLVEYSTDRTGPVETLRTRTRPVSELFREVCALRDASRR